MSGRKRATEDLPVITHDNSAGGKYRVGGTGPEESADKSAEWGREDTEESALEDKDETAGGAWEVGMILTTTAEESELSGTEDSPGGAEAGGGATSEDTDAARPP